MPLVRRLWPCLPLVLVSACSFDTRGLRLGDGSVGDGSVAVTDGHAIDGNDGPPAADSGQTDVAAPTDQGASDATDASGGDAPCAIQCSGKLCGAGDGCGGTCQPGSGCCAPSCAGRRCGDGDGCGGTCQPGSGCCAPSCNGPVCGGHDGCGGTCHGNNGDACGAPAETWRCVWIDAYGNWGSQVCRAGTWQTYDLNPRSCSGCCGSFSPDCCPSAGCPN